MPKEQLPDHKALLNLFQSHSVAEIAQMFGVSEKTVIEKIAEARHKRIVLNPVKEERYNQMKKWLAEGKNFTQIARLLNISPASARQYAIKHELHSPPTGELLYGLPISCRQCVVKPYCRGLCKPCYQRFRRRRARRLIDYHDEELLILDHPRFKVFFKPNFGYEIQRQTSESVQTNRPTELEKILLDCLHREILAGLDRETRRGMMKDE